MAAPRSFRSTRSTLAVGDAVIASLVVVVVTVVTAGFEGLTGERGLLGLVGVITLSTTLWWRNAYVVTRSIRWNGNSSLVATSILAVGLGLVLLTWVFDMAPHRRWHLLVLFGWLVGLGLLRLVLARTDTNTAPVRVIIAGSTLDALAVRLALRTDPTTSYEVLGFVMDRLDDTAPDVVARMALGSIDQLAYVARRSDAELVVVCLGAIEAERFASLVRELNHDGVDVALSTGLGKVAMRRLQLGDVSGRPLVRITPPPLGGWHLRVKRTVDVLGASLLLVLSAPLLALAWVAIRIEGGGSAIFKQLRVGKGGEPFTIFKLRTMVSGAEELKIDLTNDLDGPVFKMEADPRITRVGALLRKTSIDELPQLVNILRGEMSLVGPRPLPIDEVEAAPSSFLDRQAVKPGLTGRWQVSGRSDTNFDELDELDRWYVDNWSLGQDLEILARTLPAVLLARGAR